MALTRIRAQQISNIDYKQATRVVTTSNIVLNGGAPNQVDNVNLAVNDRVLVTGQSTASQNGIYFVQSLGTGSNGTWVRGADSNSAGELEAGTIIMVTEGSVYADTQWKLITNNPITIGNTALTFVQNYLANSISSGTSNVAVNSSANVAISVAGTSNVAVFSTGSTVFKGNVMPAANITYDLGSTTQRWRDIWLSNSTIYLGNTTITANSNSPLLVNGQSVVTSSATSSISLAGNVTGGNLTTDGTVSAVGNITGNYFFGNGSQLTGVTSYSNTNVTSLLAAFGSNTISSTGTITTTANIAGGNLSGTNIVGTLTTAAQTNITSVGTLGSLSVTGNVQGGNLRTAGLISATGNITGGNLSGTNIVGTLTTAAQTNITSVGTLGSLSVTANVQGGNLLTAGLISATGNITGGNLSGTNIVGTLTTAAQTNITSVGTLGSLSATGNIQGGNLRTAGLISATGNITGGNLSGTNIAGTLTTAAQTNITSIGTLGSLSATGNVQGGNLLTAGLISAAGTVTGLSFSGAGTGLTGTASSLTVGSATSATTAATVTTNAQPNITSVGILNGLTISGVSNFTGNLNITGNINATGNLNYDQVTDLVVGDPLIYIGANNTGNLYDLGMVVAWDDGLYQHGGWVRDASDGTWKLFGNVVAEPTTTVDFANAIYEPMKAGAITSTGNVNFANSNTGVGTVSTTAGWYYENSFSVAGQESEPRGIFFKPDGTRMYVVGNTTDSIIQYNLGTSWDVSTAVYSNAFVVSSQGTSPFDVHFKSDGTVMYVLDGTNDDIDQYNLSSAWDIGTASFASIQFSVPSQESAPTGFWFKPDGTKLYVTGSTGDDVNEYNLGTAWNVSTASFLRVSTSLTTYEPVPEGLAFSSDGTKMWIVGSTYNRITQFDLSTPWDVSTLTFNSWLPIAGSGPYFIVGSSGLYVNESAGVAYVSDYQNDRIFQYATDTPSGELLGPQWTSESDFNVGNNLGVNQSIWIGGTGRIVGALTSSTSVSSPTFNTTTSSGTTSLLTGVVTGIINFATGITTGTLNTMTAQTTGNYIVGGTSATGVINIGRSIANQSIIIGNGVTGSGNIKTIDIGTLGASGSNTNVTIGSATSGSQTNITLYGNTAAGNLQTSGIMSATGNVTGGNIVTAGLISATGNITGGNLSGTSIAGTLTTAAQTNITSVGTLGSLSATGNVTGGNIVTAGAVRATGSVFGSELYSTQSSGSEGGQINLAQPASGSTLSGGLVIDAYDNKLRIFENGGTSRGAYIDLTSCSAGVATNLLAGAVAGSNTFVQFNDGGAFGANSQFTYNKVTNLLTVSGNISGGNLLTAGLISATGNITGGNLSGTNIAGTLTTAAQTNITSVGTLSSLSATGNITGGNINTAGLVSATGNIITSSRLGIGTNAPAYPAVISVSQNSSTVLQVVNSNAGTQATSLIQLQAGASSGYVNLTVSGAANYYAAQGANGITVKYDDFNDQNFRNSAGATQFRIASTASAVNYLQVTGGATGTGVTLSAQGGDTNVAIAYFAKGTGAHYFYNSAGNPQFVVSPTASAVNYLQINGNVTTATPYLSAQGTDTNVNLGYLTRGTGVHDFWTNSGSFVRQFRIGHTASAVNYLLVAGNTTGNGCIFRPDGSDTNIPMNFTSKGTSSVATYTNSYTNLQFNVTHTASAVNYVQVTGSATGVRTTIGAAGSDTNVGISYLAKGSEGHAFYSSSGTSIQLYVSPTASAVNYLQVTGAATSNWPIMSAQGSDTNIGMVFVPKGTGGITLSNSAGAAQFYISPTTSSVNYLQVTGAATGNEPTLSAQGSDAVIDIVLTPKSTGGVAIGATAASGYKLYVNGSFAATTKSFVIDHPTRPNMKLRYGSLEGPENGVYVRGRLKDTNTIELPDYWTGLVDPESITVQLTPIGQHQKLYVADIVDNKVTVKSENLLNKSIDCFYVIFAERKDVEKLKVEIQKEI